MSTISSRIVLVLGTLALSVGTGLIAARSREEGPDWLVFTVFAVVMAPVFVGVMLLVTHAGDALSPEAAEDSVEQAWITRATSGAFIDLVVVLGLATAGSAVLDDDTGVPLVLILVLAMTDVGMRYWLLQRREG